MRVLVGISRIFVGILFIISGLIKLNDPVGFSFKLKDYFAPEVLNLEFLVPYALVIAIFVVILEVLLGVMIIIGYAKKFTLWMLSLMIIFFTFLTFYSAYFNKVTDCGCFGDALKLTPWQSFYKDLVLLVLILILVLGRKHIKPFFTKFSRTIIMFLSFIFCLFVTYQVLQHLPYIDFRPYKIGANITKGMQMPEGAPKPVFDYHWKFEVDGKEKIVTTSGDYPQVPGGTYISVETEEIQAGYEPPIHDFSIEREGEKYTEAFLAEDNLIVIIAYNLQNTEKDGYIPVKEVTDEALKKGYKVIGLSASSQEKTEALVDDYNLNFKFYFCDETTLKTIVRSNPGILELQKGTIMQKLHWNDAKDLQLETLTTATPNLDIPLKRKLDSIAILDQQYRKLMHVSNEERVRLGQEMGLTEEQYNGDLWSFQNVIDSTNLTFVERILNTRGYPGKSMVGEPTNEAAWYVIQHSSDEVISKHLPTIKAAGEAGEIPFRLVAMMEDRHLMWKGEPQIYGTQGMSYDEDNPFIWPIADVENVNKRRAEAGFNTTLEEYAKQLFGEDFEFKLYTIEEVEALKNN
ncbi:BT_3928 family protein [Jejudonia soesokkakensis]|uniref:BT_3928 family protein n=1 Tax=Jejudonia soesokkakensis TaxID=1323432 RepID=A0ABW2MWT0_9FLAO